MAKRWIIFVLALAVVFAVVPLAAAGRAGGGGKGKLKFELVGTVVAVDGASGLTVRVKAGNKPVKPWRGEDLPLVVDSRVRVVTAEGCTPATLADVPVGARVKVRGRVDRADPANLLYVALDVKARVAADPSTSPSPAPGR